MRWGAAMADPFAQIDAEERRLTELTLQVAQRLEAAGNNRVTVDMVRQALVAAHQLGVASAKAASHNKELWHSQSANRSCTCRCHLYNYGYQGG